LEPAERLRWALEARGLVAAAWDAERLGAELEAGLLRAADAFELPRSEAAVELLRAAVLALLRAEPAAGLLRAADAFELLRAEPEFAVLRAAAFDVLRAAAFDVLRAAAFEVLRADAAFEVLRAEPELKLPRLERAAAAPSSLAAGLLRLPAFGEAPCFVLVCLATSRHSTAGVAKNTSPAKAIATAAD
jgi:hypothetical protein